MGENLLIKSGRFIKMDCARWCYGFQHRNGIRDLTDGKIYECYLIPEDARNNSRSYDSNHYILDDVRDKRTIFYDELKGLEVSLSDALIEMSKEEIENV